MARVIFLGSKFRSSIFFGGFQEKMIFLGYEDFVDIFGVITKNIHKIFIPQKYHKIGRYLVLISMHFRGFS